MVGGSASHAGVPRPVLKVLPPNPSAGTQKGLDTGGPLSISSILC